MCSGLGGKPRQMFEGTKNKRYIQIYREYLRIDGDFYNLLALSGRNLINLFDLRLKLRFFLSTP